MSSKIILIGFVCFSFILGTTCLNNEVVVYKFQNERLENNFITIQPKSPTTKSTGYTICLHAMFTTWNAKVLFESNYMLMYIDNYVYKRGVYANMQRWDYFSWFHLTVSSTTWNSFCIVYDESALVLNVTIDGNVVQSLRNYTSNLNNLTQPITIGGESPMNRFAGQVTNFNFWNRPLSLSELEQYSSPNSFSFVEQSMPQIVMWTELNITEIGNNTSNYTIEKEKLNQCQDLPVLFVDKKSYEESLKICTSFNGDLLQQGKMNECFLRKEKLVLKENCTNMFWIFNNQSKIKSANETGRDDSVEKLKFGSNAIEDGCLVFNSSKNKDINVNCLVFNSSKNKDRNVNCTMKNCFACLIQQPRMKYEFKNVLFKKPLIDKNYFLVNENGVLFTGINGKSIIKQSTFSKMGWSVFNLKNGNLTECAKLNFNGTFPIGLQSLTLPLEIDHLSNASISLQIKLTNVS
jgi:hypothetical protein